jgi:hypothetical protein
LASLAGLAEGGPARRWKLTPLGEQFLTAPAVVQIGLMLATWWTQTNWGIAYPVGSVDKLVSSVFTRLALEQLLELPAGEPAPFDTFAGRLIKEARLVWPIPDQDTARIIFKSLIERMVIDPQVRFGFLLEGYGPHERFGMEFPQLSTIQLTPFGRSFLEALKHSIQSVGP